MAVTEDSTAPRNRDSAWLLIGTLILSLAPVIFGVGWGIREEQFVTAAQIAPAAGFMYATAAPRSSFEPVFTISGDSVEHPRASGTRLYEDGRRLGPAHRPHDFVRDDGQGQFSHWIDRIYFSASDSSDPRTNGRTYTILTAARLPIATVWIWGACVLSSAAFFRMRGPSAGGWRAGWTWRIAAAVLFVVLNLTVILYSLDPVPVRGLRDSQILQWLWAAVLTGSVLLALQSGPALARVAPRSPSEARARWMEASARLGQPFTRGGWQGAALRAATLVVPFLVFACVVRLPLSLWVLHDAYNSVTLIALTAGAALWGCNLRRDWIGLVAGLTATLALFALPLAALWQHVAIHYNAVGGLLPFSDASIYYYDARRLIDGHPFGGSARRPLFVGLLSTILALTRQNLQLSLAILVLLNASAVFLLARELRNSHGPLAAAVAAIVLFLFYRHDGGCGTTLTENLGFALGTTAFAVLWRGARESHLGRICLGVGLLTLALMARAGAFFVLPALAAALSWVFRANGRWRWAIAGVTAAILIAVSLSLGVGRALSDPTRAQAAFSNFSSSLYGLVVGGKGWMQIMVDHPGAQEGGETYALAFQALRAHPMGLVEGSLRMWGAYFWPRGPYNAFAFVKDPTHGDLFQNICYLLSAFALVLAIRRHRLASMALLLAATLGHVASVPFVPPIDAGLRAYAATMPILAILVGIGAAGLVESAGRQIRSGQAIPVVAARQVPAPEYAPRSAEVFGIALVAAAVAGPLSVFAVGRPPVLARATCPIGTQSVHVRLSPGSFLEIIGNVPDVDDTRVMVPVIRERSLRATAGVVELRNDVKQYTAGHTIVNTYDLAGGRPLWLVAPTGLLPRGRAVVQVCGRDSEDPLSRKYDVFYADAAGPEIGG